jgi:spermidine/putrescine transport system ATP-binding protein
MAEEGNGASSILSISSLTKRFGETTAVDDISLDIPEGEFFTIVGPSGSGKSTLIRILAGLEQPDSGQVALRGKDLTGVPANSRPTCMVFQSLALFRHMTVGENIEFSQKVRGVPAAERRVQALANLRLVRLPTEFYDRKVTQCSGGEQQRVALARALASDPEILFFDEPLSAIDYRLRKILEVEMKALHRRTGKTFIYITHSLEEAMVMSDRIAIMRDGRLVQIGTPAEIYHRPASRFVAQFMGEVNIFTVSGGRIVELDAEHGSLADGYLVVRPEHVRPGAVDADVSFEARIESDFMLGSRSQYHLRVGKNLVIAELPNNEAQRFVAGESGRWGFRLSDSAPLEN